MFKIIKPDGTEYKETYNTACEAYWALEANWGIMGYSLGYKVEKITGNERVM